MKVFSSKIKDIIMLWFSKIVGGALGAVGIASGDAAFTIGDK